MKLLYSCLILFVILFSCRPQEEPKKMTTDSLSILRDSIRSNPQQKQLWINLYQYQLNQLDSNGAIESLQEYLKAVPDDENAGIELAWLWTSKTDSNAIWLTNGLMKSTNENIALRAMYLQALYFGNTGDTDRSLSILDSLLKSSFQFTDAYIEKGIILFDRKEYEQALDIFFLGLKIEPSNKELYYWIAESYKAIGNKTAAEDWQKKYEALQ